MKQQPTHPRPAAERLIERVITLPRITRIAMAALFALAVTLVLMPLVYQIFQQDFFSISMVPPLISTGVGLVFYGIGWQLIVGYVGETPPPRAAILWYVSVGAAACVIVLLLLFIGAATGTME
jgi:hypothetical protein